MAQVIALEDFFTYVKSLKERDRVLLTRYSNSKFLEDEISYKDIFETIELYSYEISYRFAKFFRDCKRWLNPSSLNLTAIQEYSQDPDRWLFLAEREDLMFHLGSELEYIQDLQDCVPLFVSYTFLKEIPFFLHQLLKQVIASNLDFILIFVVWFLGCYAIIKIASHEDD